MAKFEKGNTHGVGRPKGSKNIATNEIRFMFLKLLESNLETIQDDLNGLEPKDRVKFIIGIAGLCVPKLKAIELKTDIIQQPDPLTKARIIEVINEMEEKY